MSKDKKKIVLEDEDLDVKESKNKDKKKKKKMTVTEKNRLMMKFMGAFMAIVMILGTIVGFLSFFIVG